MRSDQFEFGLLAMSWKVPDISANISLKIIINKLTYSKLLRTLNLCAPTLNLRTPTPILGTPTPTFGAIFPLVRRKKYADFSLLWPSKVTRPISFWLQCQGLLMYTSMSNWWTGPLALEKEHYITAYSSENFIFRIHICYSPN